jgi:hypothetical protein
MLLLTSTSDLIQVITSAAGTVKVHASYVDNNAGTITPGRTNTPTISTAATTTVVASPASSVQRNVKKLSVRNTDASVTQTITVQHTDGTNVEPLWIGTLLAGECIVFDAEGDWQAYNSAGIQKTDTGSGRLIGTPTVLTAASGTFTTSAATRTIRIRGVAGGGGGAGCTSVAAAASAGGGGGAGGYAEKVFAVTPNTGYSYTCGPAGAGASGAAGGNGTNSTFIVGGVTVTANAGQGAPVATAVTTLIAYRGGQGGAVSTNGDVNGGGAPGLLGIIYIAAGAGVSGGGGSTVFGGGGLAVTAVGNGNNATGFGAGGSGALTGASAVRTGGSGTPGCWIVEEFS